MLSTSSFFSRPRIKYAKGILVQTFLILKVHSFCLNLQLKLIYTALSEFRTHQQNLAEAQAAAYAVIAGQRTRALVASTKQTNKDSQVYLC